MEPTPLPFLDSPEIQKLRLSDYPGRYRAYSKILQAEQRANEQQAEENVISARIAGYLLLEFHARPPTFNRACESIVEQVTSVPQDPSNDEWDVIFGVGKLCRDKFIRLFRTTTTSYPPPSSHPSRVEFDALESLIKDSMESTGKDYRTSRRRALARDGFRCVITGRFDLSSVQKSKALRDMAERDRIHPYRIEASHILSESTMQGIDSAGTSTTVVNKTSYAAGAMAMLESFGFSKLVEEFKKSGGVHQVWNILSLQHELHFSFDRLDLWFEETDKPHQYNIRTHSEFAEEDIRMLSLRAKRYLDGAPIVVEFASQFDKAPPPDPRLLALHAICARVAHMSGAAEFIDKLYRDAEDSEVLASDGSSAPLLSNLISPFAVVEGVA